MRNSLNILMISHHRRVRAFARPHAMARQMVAKGHKVSMIVTSEQRRFGVVESMWDGVSVIEAPDLLWGRLRSGWGLWSTVSRILYLRGHEEHFDILHCFETRPATIYPALFYYHRHRPVLITDWNDWWGRGGVIDENRPGWYRTLFGGIETYYEEAFRARADGLTVISAALKQRAIDMGIPADSICHIPGGAFPDRFQPHSLEECRKHIGLPLSDPILGYSSMDAQGEFPIMLETLAIVARRYPTVKLLITGNINKSIVEMARSYGVEDNVHLTGYLPFEELPWYLGAVNVFILPFPDKVSNLGRWPNKIGDYMCVGRPIVSNPVGDIAPLFREHRVGLLARWDPADFAKEITYLIENPDVATMFGQNGRQLAVTKYDWKILSGGLEDFYHKLLGEKREAVNANDSKLPVNI
jgi:glycosyltransferase involved in cell wall biosynthesis